MKEIEVIGADGVYIGIVDRIEGERIKLKEREGYEMREGHYRYVEVGYVAGVEGNKIRLSVNADIDIAVTPEEEESGRPAEL